MTRLLIILLAAGVVALGAAWIADHDSVLMLIVGDYEIRTTAAVAIALLLVCFMALWLVLRVLFAIFAASPAPTGSRSPASPKPRNGPQPKFCRPKTGPSHSPNCPCRFGSPCYKRSFRP